jgi:hypothetical protein
MDKRTVAVNSRFTERQKKRLERLARSRELSVSAYLRLLVDREYAAQFKKEEVL